jgi:hypothetical protein
MTGIDYDEGFTFHVSGPAEPMPVELLRDGRGIYGIGVSDWFDYEAVCWSCGIEPDPYITVGRPPTDIIQRPDRFSSRRDDIAGGHAVLQKISGGFSKGPFRQS